MCMFGALDPQVQNDFSTARANGTPPNPDVWRRLVLGGFGDFANRVREAGLGTSVAPKSLGTVIPDTTRQTTK